MTDSCVSHVVHCVTERTATVYLDVLLSGGSLWYVAISEAYALVRQCVSTLFGQGKDISLIFLCIKKFGNSYQTVNIARVLPRVKIECSQESVTWHHYISTWLFVHFRNQCAGCCLLRISRLQREFSVFTVGPTPARQDEVCLTIFDWFWTSDRCWR